jgi:hypothetical protein
LPQGIKMGAQNSSAVILYLTVGPKPDSCIDSRFGHHWDLGLIELQLNLTLIQTKDWSLSVSTVQSSASRSPTVDHDLPTWPSCKPSWSTSPPLLLAHFQAF